MTDYVVLDIAVVVIFAASLMYVVDQSLSLPVVQIQAPDGECVRVIPPEYTCDNLPTKYTTEWVKYER